MRIVITVQYFLPKAFKRILRLFHCFEYLKHRPNRTVSRERTALFQSCHYFDGRFFLTGTMEYPLISNIITNRDSYFSRVYYIHIPHLLFRASFTYWYTLHFKKLSKLTQYAIIHILKALFSLDRCVYLSFTPAPFTV